MKAETLLAEIDDLTKFKPNIRFKTMRYCASVGTEYDGRSHQISKILLQNLAHEEDPDPLVWQPIVLLGTTPIFTIRTNSQAD